MPLNTLSEEYAGMNSLQERLPQIQVPTPKDEKLNKLLLKLSVAMCCGESG